MTVGRAPLNHGDDPAAANERWWDRHAREYLNDHGAILGDAEFIWGPEGLHEADVELLGRDLSGRDVLEIGCGAAQCSRYLALRGVNVTAADFSHEMLKNAERLSTEASTQFPLVRADARSLPFEAGSFDVVFTSFGVLPFVPNLTDVHREVARVLRPGGAWVYSAMHPVRWMFPDDPTRKGMGVRHSYFDHEPYVERTGVLEYAEFHHTFADHMNSLRDTGFVVDKVIEPEWPADRDVVWGGWGPERSPFIPGTLIVRSVRT